MQATSHHQVVTKLEDNMLPYLNWFQELHARNEQMLRRCSTAGVAVESKVVLGAALKTSDLVLGGKSSKTGGESSRGDLALKSKNVGSKTSNVGSSHGGTRDGVGTAVEPGGEDGNTWSVDVDNGSVVGERSNAVGAVSRTNSVDSRLRGGRRAGSVSAIVTGGNGEENTSRNSVGSG
jgi:hypothetical protein